MTEELIQQKASEFEFTDGIYGFKEGVKWALIQLKKNDSQDGISVDLHSYTVSNKGKILKVPKKILQLINYFIMNKGKVVTRQEILDSVWGTDVYVGDKTIDVHIRKIKIALENDDCIESVKGIGFRWVG